MVEISQLIIIRMSQLSFFSFILHVDLWPIWIASINPDVPMWSIAYLREAGVITCCIQFQAWMENAKCDFEIWVAAVLCKQSTLGSIKSRWFKDLSKALIVRVCVSCSLLFSPSSSSIYKNRQLTKRKAGKYRRKFAYCKILGQQRCFFHRVFLLKRVCVIFFSTPKPINR